jgi:predicted dehydrogenase
MDLGRWIVGDEIASVEATMANRMHPVIKTEDTAEGLIKYKNGARTVFYATNNYGYDAPAIIETFCENGIVNLDYNQATITYIDGRENIVVGNPNEGFPEKTFIDFFHTTPMAMMFEIFAKWGLKFSPIRWKGTPRGGGFAMSHFKQIKNFYDSIDANVLPDIHGEEALATHEMMWAVYQSAREKKEIHLH